MTTTPLATGSTVRLRPAPACDPPYDDERDPDAWPILVQPPLDLEPPPPRSARTRRTHPAAPATPASGTPRSGLPGASPPTKAAATRFMSTCLEILNGLRPITHFRELANPLDASAVLTSMTHATRRLQRAARVRGTHGDGRVRLRRMRTCEPRPGVAEIAAVLEAGNRVWAAAFRLERRHGRWQCAAAVII